MSYFLKCCCLLAVTGIIFDAQRVSALLCYDCNSAYDPRCGNPFDDYTLGVVNCSFGGASIYSYVPSQYSPTSLCRKLVQKVYGVERVIRSCGYIGDRHRNDKECVRRAGTHDVFSTYCTCTTDLCNAGNTVHSTVMMTAIFAIMAGFSQYF